MLLFPTATLIMSLTVSVDYSDCLREAPDAGVVITSSKRSEQWPRFLSLERRAAPTRWAPNSPHDSEPNTGHDSVIGQNAAGCFIRVPVDAVVENDVQLSLPTDPWVVISGGGYFFTPSISALAGALSQSAG